MNEKPAVLNSPASQLAQAETHDGQPGALIVAPSSRRTAEDPA